MYKDLERQFRNLLHNKQFVDAAKLSRRFPSNWEMGDQIPSAGPIPPEQLHDVLANVKKSPTFFHELSANLHPDLSMNDLVKIGEHSKDDWHVADKIKSHPNWDLSAHPETEGKQLASDFWRSYEGVVHPAHFAAVKSMYSGSPEEVATHRSDRGENGVGHSHGKWAVSSLGQIASKTENPRIWEEADRSRGPHRFGFKIEDAIPHLQGHAKDVQSELLSDPSSKIRYFQGKPYIKLFRGTHGEYADKLRAASEHQAGAVDHKRLRVKSAPLTSWTTNQETAGRFAAKEPNGVVMEAWHPISSVLHSGYHTVHFGQNHGHVDENEVVVGHPNGNFHVSTANLHMNDGNGNFLKPALKPKDEPKKNRLAKGERGDWKKEGYTIEHIPNRWGYPLDHPDFGGDHIKAYDTQGNEVGSVFYATDHPEDNWIGVSSKIEEPHRRKGLATAMYQAAEKISGKKIKQIVKDDGTIHGSSDAKALWNQPNRPFGKSENIADIDTHAAKNHIKKNAHLYNNAKLHSAGHTSEQATARVREMRANGIHATVAHVSGPKTGPKSKHAILVPNSYQELEKSYYYKGTFRPEHSDKDGSPHPDPNKPYVKVTTRNGPAWAHEPQLASRKESEFQSNFNKLYQSKALSPEGKTHLLNLAKTVAKDPERHVIATESNGQQSLRLRHLSDAMAGKPGYSISEENGLKITAPRHSGNPDNAGESHSWHFNGKDLKFLGKTPIRKSLGGDHETLVDNDGQRKDGASPQRRSDRGSDPKSNPGDGRSRFGESNQSSGRSGPDGRGNGRLADSGPVRGNGSGGSRLARFLSKSRNARVSSGRGTGHDSGSVPGRLEKGARGDWQNEGMSLYHLPNPKDPNRFVVYASHPSEGGGAGFARFKIINNDYLMPDDDNGDASVYVDKNHRRKGLGSGMYAYAQKLTGLSIKPSEQQSDSAEAMWSQLNRPFGKSKDQIPGGLADNKTPKDFDKKALRAGLKVELEHTNNPAIAKEISMDHLTEDPKYYTKLREMEKSKTSTKNQFAGGTFEKILEEGPGYKVVANFKHGGMSHGSPTPIQKLDTSSGSGQFGNGLYLAHDDDTAKFHAQGMRQGSSGQRPKGNGFVYKGSFHSPVAVLVHDDEEFGKHMMDDENVNNAYESWGEVTHPKVTKHWGNAVKDQYGANALVFSPNDTGVITPFRQTLAMEGSKFKPQTPKKLLQKSEKTIVTKMAKLDKSHPMTKSIPHGFMYISMDGDNAGGQVERAALQDDIGAIRDISDRIRRGSDEVRAVAEKKFGAQTIIHGGDDLGFLIPVQNINSVLKIVNELRDLYKNTSGFSITAGIGDSIPRAVRSLLYGKTHGKDQAVIWSHEIDKYIDTLDKQVSPEEKIIESKVLQKGAMRHIAPYDPIKEATVVDEAKTTNWLRHANKESRDSLPRMEGNARLRGLNKIMARTQTRKNKDTGETEYLLHRGMSHLEAKIHKGGTVADKTSWTSDLGVAKQFGNKRDHVISAWIPEKHIHHMPFMHSHVPGIRELNAEAEVIVNPHAINIQNIENVEGHKEPIKLQKSEKIKEVASIAVFDPARRAILMGKRQDNRKWTLPGGHLDAGETPIQGAARELKEEADIETDALRHLGTKQVTTPTGEQRIIHSFLLHGNPHTSSKNDPDKETRSWEWIPVPIPNEIMSNLHSPKNVTLQLLGLQNENNLSLKDLLNRVKKSKAAEDFKDAQDLGKAQSRITLPGLPDVTNRPDQEVKVLTGSPNQTKSVAKMMSQIKRTAQTPSYSYDAAVESTNDPESEGVHDPASGITIAKNTAPLSTIEHEGFHKLTTDLVSKHGISVAHGAYDEMLSKIPDSIHGILDKILKTNENYKKMSESDDPRFKLAYKEEKINLIRDFTQKGPRRDLLEQMFDPRYKQTFVPNYGNVRALDSDVKRTWKNIVNHAKTIKR